MRFERRIRRIAGVAVAAAQRPDPLWLTCINLHWNNNLLKLLRLVAVKGTLSPLHPGHPFNRRLHPPPLAAKRWRRRHRFCVREI